MKWPIDRKNNHREESNSTVLCFKVNFWERSNFSGLCYKPSLSLYVVVKTLRTKLKLCELQVFGKDVEGLSKTSTTDKIMTEDTKFADKNPYLEKNSIFSKFSEIFSLLVNKKNIFLKEILH